MGVLNCTPNSFSDGGEISSRSDFLQKLKSFGNIEAIDLGAESTAPMNGPISWEEEWERLRPYMSVVRDYPGVLSFDTYHAETMDHILRYVTDYKFNQKIFWNDVSGKFDSSVKEFLKLEIDLSYVLCHNLAPTRKLSGKHMNYVDEKLKLEDVADFFAPFAHPQVIFDPCLGFSKTYEQNWEIIDRFDVLQKLAGHDRWLLGFSRKSFLRKKYNLSLDQKDDLDRKHQEVFNQIKFSGELWLRTHRPELL